jgi:hypothetical protein
MFEPGLLFISVHFGSALIYPAVLSHPVFIPLESFSVWMVTVILGTGVLTGSCLLASKGSGLRVLAIIAAAGLLAPVPTTWHGLWSRPPSGQAPLVLLGLDSLSHDDNLGTLKAWSQQNRGTWYSRAVPPGLLTNSVWTSMIMMQPVREHGVFHILQHFPETKGKKTLIEKAQAAGYRTVSVFSDQVTSWVGKEAGFDDDRSGPLGWRQLATSVVENASLLLPLFRPLIPGLPLSAVPANHVGTFTYDLAREFKEIFSMRDSRRPIFVAAHSTYLHTAIFPRYTELSREESQRVLRAPVHSLWDPSSFDWGASPATEPLRLRKWKVQQLQKTIIQSIERTKFLSPERGGHLLIFSDHGNRTGLNADNFWEERYHHVLLVTFGLQTQRPEKPISLLDAGSLLGLVPTMAPFDPIVEFALSQPSEWSALGKDARPRWDGSIDLDEGILSEIFVRLRSYRPWPRKTTPRILPVFKTGE